MIKFGFLILWTGFWIWVFEDLINILQDPWSNKIVTVGTPLWDNFLNAPGAYIITVGAVVMVLGLLDKHVQGKQ